jgi:hypothetical protein
MTRLALALLLAILAATLTPTPSSAQETYEWSDTDCAQSKIVAPPGLRCRETNIAGTRGVAKSTGGGLTKRWNAFGTIGQAKLYYYVSESIDTGSYIQVGQLVDVIRNVSPQAKDARNMSAPAQRAGVDVVTFTSAKDSCVGFRKLGPSSHSGYRWVLYATRCVPAGQKVPDADSDAFITAADFRS